jgi:hypothetical protein
MIKIERNNDVVFNNNDLEHLHTFKNFPVFMGCIEDEPSKDILFDMRWKISKKSGMIQLNPLLPLETIYSFEHGSGTVGKAWDEHHEEFANFISKYEPQNILEIGGLHGILAKKYLSSKEEANWTIVEPNPTIEETDRIKVIKGFFDNNFTSSEKFDAVLHSHVLEHIYDPDEFMSHKSSFMNIGNLLFFSIPNLETMLQNKYNNCINFEHTIYFTEPYIEYFLNKYNFELVEKQYFRNDHSIFYCAKKVDNISSFILPEGLYNKNKSTFINYINHHSEDVIKINNIIDNTNLPVYLFGAHIFSQYLISFGLNTSKIVCILDNDIKKENKRLYGTSLISKSPKILKDVPEAIVILRAAGYNEEIKNDILTNINSNIIFI